MNKREIIAYFDARAPEWDARMVRSDSKIAFILDAAGVRPGVSVLDVACGTGVLFGDYLARDAARVTGVDISPEMARIAVSKLRDPRVEVLCGDVEELAPSRAGTTAVWYTMRSPISPTPPGCWHAYPPASPPAGGSLWPMA